MSLRKSSSKRRSNEKEEYAVTRTARRKKPYSIFRIAAVLIFVSAILLPCAVSGGAIDFDRKPSLYISPGESQYLDSLREAKLTADLYLLAEAVARPGEDAYDFKLVEPYTKLKLPTDDRNADWQAVAQSAMSVALTDGTPLVTGAPIETSVTQTDGGNSLPFGLYLMLIRGKEPAAYVEDASDGSGKVTVAYSGDDTFLFSPELISLPTRPVSQDAPANTASDGDWIYDLTVYTKFVHSSSNSHSEQSDSETSSVDQDENTKKPDSGGRNPVVKTGDDTPSLLPFYIAMGVSGLLLLALLVSMLVRRRRNK